MITGQPRLVFVLPGLDRSRPRTGGELVYCALLDHADRRQIPYRLIDGSRWPGRLRRHMVAGRVIANFLLIKSVVTGRNTWVVTDSSLHTHLVLPTIVRRLLPGRPKLMVGVNHLTHLLATKRIIRLIEGITEPFLLRSADAVVAISESAARESARSGVSTDGITIAPPLLHHYDALVARPPTWTSGSERPIKNVLYVGSVYERKGVLFLVEAMAAVPRSLMLDIVGSAPDDSPYVEMVRTRVDALGLSHRVQISGRLSDDELQQRYAQADLFVLPSLMEGYGIVLLEAMLYGLPIIATDAGAIPEVVRDGVEGLLVPPGDQDALASAITRLAEDDGLRERLARAGRERGLAIAASPTHAEIVCAQLGVGT